MVELGLCAKQEKADRFQHVKKEINEMVKMRVSQLKSKVSYSLYFSLLHTFSNNAENDGYIFG
jgi:hypothetical protein